MESITYETVNMSGEKHHTLGIISLILAAIALVLTPVLGFIPIVGFLLPLTALGGIIVAIKGVKTTEQRTVTPQLGLAFSLFVLLITISFTLWWNFHIVAPAINDFTDLHEVFKFLP